MKEIVDNNVADHLKSKEVLLKDLKVLRAAVAVLQSGEEGRKKAEQKIEFLCDIMQKIFDAKDFTTAQKIAVEMICEKTNWAFGQIWFYDSDNLLLELSPVYYLSSEDFIKFRHFSEKFNCKGSLPLRVLENKVSIWVKDISLEKEFPRSDVANEVGLKAGLAVPISYRGRIIAVMEFFMKKSCEKDAMLVWLVSSIGAQLGAALKLKQLESYR